MILRDLFSKKKEVIDKSLLEPDTRMNALDLDLPPDEIVAITDSEIIDTESPEALAKFKHNLEVLMNQAKEKGKVTDFKIIRDDNHFPFDWKWHVASRNTCFEFVGISLSIELKKYYAALKNNLIHKINGVTLPIDEAKLLGALKTVPKTLGFVKLPVKFRSTKHFTINTPLEATGDYNAVEVNRLFTIIDDIDNFLNSGYAYSMSYHDAYLDVTHEDFPISLQAVVLIKKDKYEEIKNNTSLMEELKKRRIIVYTGEEYLAINMVLTEMGVLPSKIGAKYAYYDQEIYNILDNSLKSIASSHGILYDKSHFAYNLKNGHFSSYYDNKNDDYNLSVQSLVNFLKERFPPIASEITISSINSSNGANELIEKINPDELLKAIEEFNNISEIKFQERLSKFIEDKANITPQVSEIFKKTVKRIGLYYENKEYQNIHSELKIKIEELIRHFYHDDSSTNQLKAAEELSLVFQLIDIPTVSDEVNIKR